MFTLRSISGSAGSAVRYLLNAGRYYVGDARLTVAYYLGRGAEVLGLRGGVSPGELQNLLEGYSQDRTEKWVQNAGRVTDDGRLAHHFGWDGTFSAPKAFSTLWALVEKLRVDLERIHRGAVAKAFTFLEEPLAFTRRGKGGAVVERAQGLVAVASEHYESRLGDPQLHTHVVFINVVPRMDGTTGTIHGIDRPGPKHGGHKLPLFELKKEAGAVYRAALADGLRRDLGLDVTLKGEHGFEIAGVPHELVQLFSKRRHSIERELERVGSSDAKSAGRAAILTRPPKRVEPLAEMFERWKREAEPFRIELTPAKELTSPSAVSAHRPADERLKAVDERLWRAMGRGLRQAATFEALSHHAWPRGLDGNERREIPERVRRLIERFQGGPLARLLHPGARPVSVRAVKAAMRDTQYRGSSLGLLALVRGKGALRTVTGTRSDQEAAITAAATAWSRNGHRVTVVSSSPGELRVNTGLRAMSPGFARAKLTGKRTHRETLSIMSGRNRFSRPPQFKTIKGFLRYAEVVKQSPPMRFNERSILILDRPDQMSDKDLKPILKKLHSAGGTLVVVHDPPIRIQEREQTPAQAIALEIHRRLERRWTR